MTQHHSQDDLRVVVGEEKRLTDLLCAQEVDPLLDSIVRAGIRQVRIVDESGQTLWRRGEAHSSPQEEVSLPLKLEGETVGRVMLSGDLSRVAVVQSLASVLSDMVKGILHSNLKRLLTTEIHTHVVQQSYEELLETNKRLSRSEAKYRELAKTLEQKVEQRTAQLKKAHALMLQQEKLAAVGQLAAGMAHEINNPLGFVNSNFSAIARYFERLKGMLQSLQASFGKKEPVPQIMAELKEKWQGLKISFILDDMDDLVAQSVEGCGRIQKIVADLKGFSHVDDAELKLVDLNEEIERTLNVLAHRLPQDARIVKRYQKIPGFLCNPALLCQVFFNIIQNACQARPTGLHLLIETQAKGESLIIRFKDNGPGIPKEIQHRIFEPFFTTRDVGEGPGMGLAMSYEVIASYNGTITMHSEDGQGAIFSIVLPLAEKI